SRHSERRFAKKIQKEVKESPVFNRAFTGFTLLDPETGKTLADVNGDKYFTPASNTKILTLATCLEVLGDSVPGMIWWEGDRSISITPVGDPTFLHPKFQYWQSIFDDLRKTPQGFTIEVNPVYGDITPLGPGWAWDDTDFDFSAERTYFPMYGNVKRLFAVNADSLSVEPGLWQKLLFKEKFHQYSQKSPFRHTESNAIWYNSASTIKAGFETFIPVRNSQDHLPELLIDTLQRQVKWNSVPDGSINLNHLLRYSTPLDTVLRRMMYQSDNFIAEQMLLVCAGQKFDILQQDTMIKWMLDSVLINLPQRPRWVDGSGLSRYNLISPNDLSLVLLKLWKEQPHEYLMTLFPAGGMNGTVADWYKGKDGKPYVFAKTGGMSGVHCLSGYVVTKSGKTLIFSFMHNNFVGSNKPWKQEMQRVLEVIWESN
ncbi:MAG TPA: D-alanyl-D-alanine carboxypeptidase, partial [Saprospiraceae bacterium]|nr:D-alanyl-D-alanine carboxypeptidase [Saprospiraceae bacterium]